MFDLLILGGGYAGSWAAMSAARQAATLGRDLRIALVSDTPQLVARVRLYEHDLPPEEVATPLDALTAALGIEFQHAAVSDVAQTADGGAQVALADGRELLTRAVVLALGSRLALPTVAVSSGVLHDIDTANDAARFWAALRGLPAGATVQVVGGGFTGIELACDLVGWSRTTTQPLRVRLVDRAHIAASYAPAARDAILGALHSLAIEIVEHTAPQRVENGDLLLANGDCLAGDLAVYCGGLQPHPLATQLAERHALARAEDGRFAVTPTLRIPASPNLFAAGDVAAARADGGAFTTFSCQHALSTGTCAGHNAVQLLCGESLAPYRPARPYGTCLDLGPAGALLTSGFARELVNSGSAVKAIKQHINRQLVVPPIAAGRAALFAAAALPSA